MDGLPNEILGKIFTFAQPNRSISLYPPQEAISRVSRRLRTVVLSLPWLWTDIRVYSEKSLPRAHEYLTRSSNEPISLTLDTYDAGRNWKSDISYVEILTGILVECLERMSTLVIIASPAYICFYLLSTLRAASAPCLEKITILCSVVEQHFWRDPTRYCSSALASYQPIGPLFLGAAPRLHSAYIPSANISSCILPMSRLTSLTLDISDQNPASDIGPMELQSIATDAPFLEDLTLMSNDTDIRMASFENLLDPITMPKLRALRFVGDTFLVDPFLASLEAPNLASLRLESLRYEELFDDVPVFPSLLYISFYDVGHQYFRSISLISPNVECLEVSFCEETVLIKALAIILNDSAWPQITTIVWRTRDMRYMDSMVSGDEFYQLISFLENRKALGKPLKLIADQDTFDAMKGQSDMATDAVIERLGTDTYREAWFVKSHEDSSGIRLI